jgi:hypothetical protein
MGNFIAWSLKTLVSPIAITTTANNKKKKHPEKAPKSKTTNPPSKPANYSDTDR